MTSHCTFLLYSISNFGSKACSLKVCRRVQCKASTHTHTESNLVEFFRFEWRLPEYQFYSDSSIYSIRLQFYKFRLSFEIRFQLELFGRVLVLPRSCWLVHCTQRSIDRLKFYRSSIRERERERFFLWLDFSVL